AVGIFGVRNEGASFAFVFLPISDMLPTGSRYVPFAVERSPSSVRAVWSAVLIRKLQDGGQDQVRTGTQQKVRTS
ncbi:hypothetical protein L227DRAFT_582165, partial [Lentinus tigrinus ALCF2SS1-6]